MTSVTPAGPKMRRLRLSVTTALAATWLASCAGSSSVQTASSHNLKLPTAAEVAVREQTADQQVQHVLNRLAFGPRPGDVQAVRAMGVDVWVARQLEPERINDAPMVAFVAQFPTLSMTGEELLNQFPPPGQLAIQLAAKAKGVNPEAGTPRGVRPPPANATQGMLPPTPQPIVLTPADSLKLKTANADSYRVTGEVATAKVARAIASERQLDEVMVDFWENHFTVFAGKDRIRYFLPEFDAQTIRPHALGKFRELLGAVAKSPAMLYYLDNWQSVADSGRPTLQQPGRRAAANGAAPRPAVNARLQRMTVGELLDRDLMPKAQRTRFEQLPAERLEEVRKLTLAEAQTKLAQQVQAAPRRPRGLNENYARELMELHTLGVDGGYTQHDVTEVARALTGWTVARGAQGGEFVFRGEQHDAGEKTILGVKFPAGRGAEEGEQLLDMLAHSPSTARFIATKLARRFVSDSPPPVLIARAAATFTRTDGDIRETLRTIVTSPEFFATAAYRAKVKSPFELVASTMRAMGARPDSTPRIAQFVNRLGQPIFGHLTPDGYPEVGDAWMNTGSILNRINFGLAAAGGRVPGIRLADWSETKTLASLSREQQVDGVVRALLGGSVSPDTRGVLLTGTNPFLESKAAQDTLKSMANRADVDDTSMMGGSDMGAAAGAGGRGNGARANQRADQRADRVPLNRQQQQLGRDVAKPGQGQSLTQAIGSIPTVTGLAQIVGLALGAPEFQRR